jgi:hypothetical protein
MISALSSHDHNSNTIISFGGLRFALSLYGSRLEGQEEGEIRRI